MKPVLFLSVCMIVATGQALGQTNPVPLIVQ